MRPRPTSFGSTRSRPALLALALFALAAGCSDARDSRVASAAPGAAAVAEAGATEGVRLVVYVVGDQLRADLLDRYDTVFTGGFARLRAEGLRFPNATFDHAQTSTSPGHATAATGTHPHRHGLVGNNWEERGPDGTWSTVYALRDLEASIVGSRGMDLSSMEGRGPANLNRSGLPDWMAQANPASRTVSLSGKDRAAIAMAGLADGTATEAPHVYWLESALGAFVTSTHYRAALPSWVEDFNASAMEGIWTHSVWESTTPEWALSLSRPDTSVYEGDQVNTYFPHRADLEAGDSDRAMNSWRGRQPWPDEAVLALARVAVQELELGQRGVPDYLALAISQPDRVGHEYGPLSREQLDNLLLLDRQLGEFMAFLDAELGSDGWMMALTADHGVLEIPEHRAEYGTYGTYGRRITPDEAQGAVARAERAAANARAAAVAADSREDAELEAARAAAAAVLEEEWIVDAFAWEDLVNGTPADSLQALFLHSWHPERRVGPLAQLGVGVLPQEGVLFGRYPTGTSHGSPYYYDRHVPFAILAPGVRGGVDTTRVSVVDMAPTLAELLRIPAPGDLDGEIRIRVGAGR